MTDDWRDSGVHEFKREIPKEEKEIVVTSSEDEEVHNLPGGADDQDILDPVIPDHVIPGGVVPGGELEDIVADQEDRYY